MIRPKYSSNQSAVSSTCWPSSGVRFGSSTRAKRSECSLNSSRSAVGTPIISAITTVGSGFASAEISSIRPEPPDSASASSIIPCAVARMWSSILATARGVKARLTSPRSRVWSGGSRLKMLGVSCPRTSWFSVSPLRGSLLNCLWLRRIWSQSSYRVSTRLFVSGL